RQAVVDIARATGNQDQAMNNHWEVEVYACLRVPSLSSRFWRRKGTAETPGSSVVVVRCAFVINVLICMSHHGSASADTRAAAGRSHDLNIIEARLDRALGALARQTGAQLIFNYESLRRYPAPPLVGVLRLEQALEVLLENTPFVAHVSG